MYFCRKYKQNKVIRVVFLALWSGEDVHLMSACCEHQMFFAAEEFQEKMLSKAFTATTGGCQSNCVLEQSGHKFVLHHLYLL